MNKKADDYAKGLGYKNYDDFAHHIAYGSNDKKEKTKKNSTVKVNRNSISSNKLKLPKPPIIKQEPGAYIKLKTGETIIATYESIDDITEILGGKLGRIFHNADWVSFVDCKVRDRDGASFKPVKKFYFSPQNNIQWIKMVGDRDAKQN